MPPPRVVGLGEVLWDLLPSGPVIGGAPANFALLATELGARATLISKVGEDKLGQRLIDGLQQRKLETAHIQRSPKYPTSTVMVQLDGSGNPSYHIAEPVAWDFLSASCESSALIRTADVLCFGTLAQRFSTTEKSIQQMVEEASAGLRILDLNLRLPHVRWQAVEKSLRLTQILRLNVAELDLLASRYSLPTAEDDRLAALRQRYSLQCVVLSKGERGSIAHHAAETFVSVPGIPCRVNDTVGAGDAFTATMALGMYAGFSMQRTLEHASRVASFVCTQAGATPRLPQDLKIWF